MILLHNKKEKNENKNQDYDKIQNQRITENFILHCGLKLVGGIAPARAAQAYYQTIPIGKINRFWPESIQNKGFGPRTKTYD